jgi:DNA-directed RNA polymerase subunit RPC12/RpoP
LKAGFEDDMADAWKGGEEMEQDQTSPVRFIEHPVCRQCGKPEWLIRIEPAEPGYEKRTYECPECGQKQSMLVSRTSPLRNRAA